jgi:hypothetical protein
MRVSANKLPEMHNLIQVVCSRRVECRVIGSWEPDSAQAPQAYECVASFPDNVMGARFLTRDDGGTKAARTAPLEILGNAAGNVVLSAKSVRKK